MKSTAGIFFKKLLRSFFWMILLFLTGWISYTVTYYYLEYRGAVVSERQSETEGDVLTDK